jgi:CMP-N,N'-diacetyllegionaminic acid synthase
VSKNKPEVLGIVGIRSGSKGLPHKNIRDLAGKPLVGWVLDAAKKCNKITRLIVSTDSEEYKNVAINCGAEVPFLRPNNLAEDGSPEIEFVKDLLNWLRQNENYQPDIIVRMLATVPLQKAEDLTAIIDILEKDSKADSAVVIAEARQHPLKALKIIEDKSGEKKLVTYFSESGREATPIGRQNYEKAYFRANVIACRTEIISKTNSLTGDLVRYHIIPQERSIDIDNAIDFFMVENLMNLNQIKQ